MTTDRESMAPSGAQVTGQPVRSVRRVVRSLQAFLVPLAVLGVGFTVAAVVLDPFSAILSLAIMVPLYAWFHSTMKPRMLAQASAAQEVSDPERQSKMSLAVRPAAAFLVLAPTNLALFLWSASGDGLSGIVGGVLVGLAVTTFCEFRWWRQWEDLHGVQVFIETGWSWRGSATSADGPQLWFVRNGGDSGAEASAAAGTVNSQGSAGGR